MNKKVKNLVKKVIAVSAGAGIVVGTFLGATFLPQEKIVFETEVLNATQEQMEKSFQEGVDSVVIPEPEVIFINQTQLVEVDNGNLDFVLKQLYDNQGSLELVTEDLFEDELDLIVDRLFLFEEHKALAIQDVKDNLAKELDYQLGYDRRDVSRIVIKTEDVTIDSIDFNKQDSVVIVPVEFRYDGSLETAQVEVSLRNGKVRGFDFI